MSTSFYPQTGPLNREILKNAFNFPLSSVVSTLLVIRLNGDRPLLLVFHANDITSMIEYLFKTSISIRSNRSCFLSLSLSVFLHGYLQIRYSFSERTFLLCNAYRCKKKKKNSLLVETNTVKKSRRRQETEKEGLSELHAG